MSAPTHILVIDDEPVVLEGAKRICASEGLSVVAASSAREGLQRIDDTVGLVVCDIMMENMDGFAFLAELRRLKNPPPVIMTTGYSTVEHAVRSLKSGAMDYLPKPFAADELLAMVQRGLKVGRRARAPRACAAAKAYTLGEISWAELEPEGTVRIGAHPEFPVSLGGVTRIEQFPVEMEIVQGAPCATFWSGEGLSHPLLSPISGRIIEVNAEEIADFESTWIYRILPFELNYNLKLLNPPSGSAPLQGETP